MDKKKLARSGFRNAHDRDPHDDQELLGWIQIQVDFVNKQLEERDKLLQPGTFLGDFFEALDTGRVMALEAVDRLLEKWLKRGAVFYPARWQKLESFFYERVRENNFDNAWKEIAQSAFYLAADTVLSMDETAVPLPQLFQKLRNEMRKEIERELLAGRTLDATGEERLPENYDVVELEAEYAAELAELKSTLESLPQVDSRILLAAWGEDPELAAELGIKPVALRVKRYRLLKKLKGRLG